MTFDYPLRLQTLKNLHSPLVRYLKNTLCSETLRIMGNGLSPKRIERVSESRDVKSLGSGFG